MDQPFIIQLILSIVIGGLFIATQTVLAERAPQRIAGIILSIPSTVAIGLFFMALTISPKAVVSAVPAIPAALGASLVFCTVYVYLANRVPLKKRFAILISAVAAISCWLILATPIAYFRVNNLAFSLFVYGLLAICCHYFLAIKPDIKTTPVKVHYTIMQKTARAVLGGLIIGMVISFAKFFGAFWGAVFSAFPAVYLSTLLIIHFHHHKHFLFHITKAIPLASPIFVIYALVVQYTYPRIGILAGTIAAYAICMLYPLFITYAMGKKKNV